MAQIWRLRPLDDEEVNNGPGVFVTSVLEWKKKEDGNLQWVLLSDFEVDWDRMILK